MAAVIASSFMSEFKGQQQGELIKCSQLTMKTPNQLPKGVPIVLEQKIMPHTPVENASKLTGFFSKSDTHK